MKHLATTDKHPILGVETELGHEIGPLVGTFSGVCHAIALFTVSISDLAMPCRGQWVGSSPLSGWRMRAKHMMQTLVVVHRCEKFPRI